jgi:Domain of unknown function (DUF6048)
MSQVFAQAKKETMAPADTVKNKFLPTGLRIGTDAIAIIKSHRGNNFSGWEVNADVDFSRYYLAVDFGKWSRNDVLTNGNYQNDGTYWRVGSDVNFMLKDKEKNMFFMGIRYGHSTFNESLSYSFADSLPGIGSPVTISKSLHNSGVTAHWVELTTGLRVKIWGPFWMGYTARLKFAPVTKGAGELNPFDIPGYGLAEKKNYWGLNYQLFWRFPVRRVK